MCGVLLERSSTFKSNQIKRRYFTRAIDRRYGRRYGRNRPYPDEIRQKFIITARYGKPGFPSGMGAALVICRVSCISFDGVAWTNIFIHRNTHDKHAETLVIEKLEEMGRNAKEINIELIQNYSPCNNYERDVNNVLYGCATDIVDYKIRWKNKERLLA